MPLSLFPNERFIGIDIGHCSIKIAQLERDGDGIAILHLQSQLTPPDAVGEGVVTDPQAVGGAIRHALRQARISATTANVGVAGGSVVVRTVTLPRMEEAALRKSIRYEAGRYVPSSVADSFIECEIIGEAEEGQMNVLVVASPKDMVQSRVAAAEEAGLDVEVVDVEAFALYRALIEADGGAGTEEKAIALLDVGGESSQISVVDCGAFALTRSIPIGGRMLTNALAHYFKLDHAEAEEGKLALDLTSLVEADETKENPPLRVVQPLVDELVREIRRSLNYFHSQKSDQGSDRRVTELLLAGGGSRLKGLPEYFSQKLDLSVRTPNFLNNPKFNFAGSDKCEDAHVMAVAVGLAMRRAGSDVIAA